MHAMYVQDCEVRCAWPIAKQNLKQRAGIVRKCADVCLALIELEQAEVVLVSVTPQHMQAAGDKVITHLPELFSVVGRAL